MAIGIVVFIAVVWNKKPVTVEIPVKQDIVNKPQPQPELSEAAKKRLGLSGPFPTGEETPEKERNIGRIINAWREAVVIKRIDDIKRLKLEILGIGSETIPFLTKLAREDENERVRAFATQALGTMRSADLADLYVELLQKDKSEFVRQDCIWALQELGNPKYIPVLEKTAQADESEKIRNLAREAINTLDLLNKNK